MKFRKLIPRLLFVLVFMALAAQAGRVISSRLRAQGVRPVGPIPYAVTLREALHRADGTTRVVSEVTRAIRSDGSTVWRMKEASGTERILQFSSGLEVTVNELTNTKTSMMKKSLLPASTWQQDPSSRCLNSFAGKSMTSMTESFVGEETVSGYRTAKIVRDIITEWRALDYGCALVKDRWGFGTGEVSEKELVTLVGGEPDAKLFEVPDDAKEVPPSERLLGPTKECRSCDAHARESIQKLDQEYKRLAVKTQ